jgi:hypothetical protein
MTEEELFLALSEVDLALDISPKWREIKEIASAYPLTLDEGQLTPGQQAVMVCWRCFSRDYEGQSTAPDPAVSTIEEVSDSLNVFKSILLEVLSEGNELDLDSIRNLFEMAQSAGNS